jgi:hypothetical protein
MTSSTQWYIPPVNLWNPDPTFILPNSDMVAVFLALNGLNYYDPVYDPMFNANGSRNDTIDSATFYYPT